MGAMWLVVPCPRHIGTVLILPRHALGALAYPLLYIIYLFFCDDYPPIFLTKEEINFMFNNTVLTTLSYWPELSKKALIVVTSGG